MLRTRAFALLALLCLALLAGCGGNGNDSSGGGSKDAQALLEKAFSKQVDSAQLELDVKANLKGGSQVSGPVSLSVKGPFKSNGDNRLPELSWDVNVSGGGRNITAGLVLTKDNGYVSFRDQAYEIGTRLFQQIQQSARQDQGSQKPTLKQFGIDPTEWLKNPKLEDGEDIGGDSTKKVSGDVDVKKAVKDVLGALKSPALRNQLQRQGQTVPAIPEVSDSQINKVADAVKNLKFEVNVDGNGIARRVFAEASFDVPKGVNAEGLTGGKVSLGFVLDQVGINPKIEAPANPQPIQSLLSQFGLGGGLALPQQQ